MVKNLDTFIKKKPFMALIFAILIIGCALLGVFANDPQYIGLSNTQIAGYAFSGIFSAIYLGSFLKDWADGKLDTPKLHVPRP